MKQLIKAIANGFFLLVAFLPALAAAFGRQKTMFTFFAHSFALLPGVLGDYARKAYYRLTLRACSADSCISFGALFSNRDAEVERGVFIGAYCVIGNTRIGANTLIASGVHILSGRKQHIRDEHGRILGSDHGRFAQISIGANCWIGECAVVMADVGEGSTVGAGSVVVKTVPAGVVAVGSPARSLSAK